MSNLTLVFPTMEYKQQALDYIEEHLQNNETKLQGVGGLCNAPTYEIWVNEVTNLHNKTNVAEGFVSGSAYFGVVDHQIVGMINIRHQLNNYLFNFGGHIGYGVRPTQRKKGYAKEMLKQALRKAKELDIDRVLLTCDKANIASQRTILSQGGILENEIEDDQRITQRYWIQIQ